MIKRKAFTLIELMISIMILSIMMIFLYQSYASLNRSNKIYEKELALIKDEQIRKKILYVDLLLKLPNSMNVINQNKEEDVVFFQTSNSIHKMYNPYVAYIVKNSKLYRLESLKKFITYPLSVDNEFIADYIGEVDSFRLYKNKKNSFSYLLNIEFKKMDGVLIRINSLNEY